MGGLLTYGGSYSGNYAAYLSYMWGGVIATYSLYAYAWYFVSNYFYKVSLLAWFSNWVNYCITYV